MTLQDTDPSPQTAQCSVTGKIVPEDELVTFQGQRVCAEGKAILLERLQSGEGAPGELKRPTVLRRFSCIFLDGLIIGIPTAIATAMATGSAVLGGVISLSSGIVQIVYFGAMHASGGQTVGKKAGKLMVVNLDGSKISTQTAYVRSLAYCGPGLLSGTALLLGSPALVGAATGIVSLYGLANVITALVDSTSQRAIHDRIAGTRVVDRS